MRIVKSLAACILIAVSGSCPTTAAVRTFPILTWSGSASFNDKTKQLEYCSASLKNDNGITVTYSVDRQFAWKLAFSNPNWGFAAGHAFSATIKIGEEEYRGQRAVVTGDRTFEMEVGDPIALFERLRTARSLLLQAGGLTLGFDLGDGDEVLPALVRCMVQQMPRRHAPRPPAAAAKAPLQLAPAANGAARNEAQEFATDLLAQLAFSDARFIQAREVPITVRPDVAWKKAAIIGTLSIMPPERAPSLDALVGEILNGNSPACRERIFLATASELINQTKVSRIFTFCRTLDGQMSSYYVAIPRADGGFYLVGTINTGFEFSVSRPAEELDNRIRSVVLGVVARHKPLASSAEPQ